MVFGSKVSDSWLLRIGRPKNSRLGPSLRTLMLTVTHAGQTHGTLPYEISPARPRRLS
jgi:hypothetical protein